MVVKISDVDAWSINEIDMVKVNLQIIFIQEFWVVAF